MELISASLQDPETQSESNNSASMELISASLQGPGIQSESINLISIDGARMYAGTVTCVGTCRQLVLFVWKESRLAHIPLPQKCFKCVIILHAHKV